MGDALYALNSLGNDYMSVRAPKSKPNNHVIRAMISI